LNADVDCDLIDYFLLDEGGVHVEDAEALVTAEDVFGLEDNFAIPFPFETIDGFVFAQVSEGEVFGIGRWGEADLRYSRLGRRRAQTTVGRGKPPKGRGVVGEERVDGEEEVRETHLGDISTIQVVERLRFWRRWLKRVVGDVCCWRGPRCYGRWR